MRDGPGVRLQLGEVEHLHAIRRVADGRRQGAASRQTHHPCPRFPHGRRPGHCRWVDGGRRCGDSLGAGKGSVVHPVGTDPDPEEPHHGRRIGALKEPADATLQALDEVAEWGLEALLDGVDDDAIYLLGRMREVQRATHRHEEAKAAAVRALFHRASLPTGMASETGHWMRVRGGRALSPPARRKAMGWGDSEGMLAHAAEAAKLSETQVCALELQAASTRPW